MMKFLANLFKIWQSYQQISKSSFLDTVYVQYIRTFQQSFGILK